MGEENANKKNKLLRLITGVIISIISLGAIICGGAYLFALLLVIITLCSNEFVKILKHKGFHPSLSIVLFFAIVFATLTFFHRFDLVSSMLTLTIMASFLIVLFRGRQPYQGHQVRQGQPLVFLHRICSRNHLWIRGRSLFS